MTNFIIYIFGLILIAGCSVRQVETIPSSAEILEKIQSSHEVAKTVELKLEQTQITAKTFRITLLIKNPEQKELTSAQTWLAYNPQALKIVKIDTQNSDFDLAAPGEDKHDTDFGLIKIGRSSTQNTINLAEIKMAEITVEKTNSGLTFLDFYNYHEDTTWNTTVNMLSDSRIYNLAKKTTTPALIIK